MAATSEYYQDIRKALDRMEAEARTGITWNKERLRRTLNNVVYKETFRREKPTPSMRKRR